MRVTQADVHRFFQHVSQPDGPAGCWKWTGKRDASRKRHAGMFSVGGRRLRAARFAWAVKNRRRKLGNVVLDQCCDTEVCVNPDHYRARIFKKGSLAIGKRHGRYTHPETTARGDRHGMAKLDSLQVAWIRRIGDALMPEEIAKRFGVSTRTIEAILKRRTWKDEPTETKQH